MQNAEDKSAFALYCTRQIADEPDAGGVSCELLSSESGASESLEEATSCTAQASGSIVRLPFPFVDEHVQL